MIQPHISKVPSIKVLNLPVPQILGSLELSSICDLASESLEIVWRLLKFQRMFQYNQA